MYAVILAGGVGSRLWPISRQRYPKQLHRLFKDLTLFQSTLSRILPLIPSSNIFVVTNQRLWQGIKSQASEICDIPESNILAEPMEKNTLPALGVALLHIMRRNPASVVCALPIDHFVKSEEQFRKMLLYAEDIVKTRNSLVSFGIKPTYPSTGYGYLQIGERLFHRNGIEVHKVLRVIEKPKQKMAQQFIAEGNYLWNRSVYLFQTDEMMELISRFAPGVSQSLKEIYSKIGTTSFKQTLFHTYAKMPNISIAKGLLEKVDNVLVIKTDLSWDDIGTWTGMENIFKKDERLNVCRGKHIGIDTAGCVIYSDGGLVAICIKLRARCIIRTGFGQSLLVRKIKRKGKVESRK